MQPPEQVLNVDTQQVEDAPSDTARGAAFERYVLSLLKTVYPHYAWFHQGQRKASERGLDFIGTWVGESQASPRNIGVQVKFHEAHVAPTEEEWLKFLASCFARRLDETVFITTGRLTSAQRQEAGEANILVIEGREEVARMATLHDVEAFELFDEEILDNGEE